MFGSIWFAWELDELWRCHYFGSGQESVASTFGEYFSQIPYDFAKAYRLMRGGLREVPFPTALTSLGRNPEAPESSASPHTGSVIRWEASHMLFSLCCSGLRADLYAFVHSRLLMRDSSSSNQSEVGPSNHPPYGGFPLVSPYPDTIPSNGGVNWRSRLPVRFVN